MRKKALNVFLLSALPMRVQYSRLSLCWHCDRNVGCVVLVGGEGERGDWAFFSVSSYIHAQMYLKWLCILQDVLLCLGSEVIGCTLALKNKHE